MKGQEKVNRGFLEKFLGRVPFCVPLLTHNTEGRVRGWGASPFTSCQEGLQKDRTGRRPVFPHYTGVCLTPAWKSWKNKNCRRDGRAEGLRPPSLRSQPKSDPGPRVLVLPVDTFWPQGGEGWLKPFTSCPRGLPRGVKGLQDESAWNGLLKTRR